MIYALFIIIILIILYFIFIKKEHYENDNKYYIFYISKNQLQGNCTHSLNDKKIGYISDIDKNFIRSIENGYRIKARELIKLNPIVPSFNSVDFAVISIKNDIDTTLFKAISDKNLFIYTFDTIELKRINLFMDSEIKFNKINLKKFWKFNNNLIIKYNHSVDVPVVENNKADVSVVENNKADVQIVKNKEEFITRLKRDPEIEDPEYHCYGNDKLLNKKLCNAELDPFGNKKKKISIWDRPCKKDEECDFYGKNKKYQIDGGKCINKYCELPIGVRRLSYRKYDDKGINAPFCHGNEKKECNDKYKDYIF